MGIKEIWLDNPFIQSVMVDILMSSGDISKAKEIVRREGLKDHPLIIKKVNKYKDLQPPKPKVKAKKANTVIKEKDEKTEIKTKNKDNNIIDLKILEEDMDDPEKIERQREFLNRVRTLLQSGKIDNSIIEEIKNNEDLSYHKKTIVLLAIYEKERSFSKAKEIAREARKQLDDATIVNIIIDRMNSKKNKTYNLEFYDEILNWKNHEELQEQEELEKEDEETIEQEELQNKYEEVTDQNEQIINQEETFEQDEEEAIENSDDINESRKEDIETFEIAEIEAKEIPNEIKEEQIEVVEDFSEEPKVEIQEKTAVKQHKKIKQSIYTAYTNHIIERLKKYRIKIYVNMQQKDDLELRKESIDRLDKLESLIEKLDMCLNIVNDGNTDETKRKECEKILEEMNNKFKKLEEREKHILEER